jgi:hypothetical protein
MVEVLMQIKLNLSRHCIETELKRLYNRSVSSYFKDGEDRQLLEKQIEILKSILERSDFAWLRRVCPELSGHCDADVVLMVQSQEKIVIRVNDKAIDLF